MNRLWRVLAASGALALLQACATLPDAVVRTPSAAVPANADDELGRLAAASVAASMNAAVSADSSATSSANATIGSPSFGSAVRPMPFASYAMDARLTLVRHAQKTLDLQYYLLQDDVTGHALLRAVRDAALRGVRVRLLVDDLYTAESDAMLVEFAAHPNVEVRLFNPFPAGRAFGWSRWAFALADFSRVNHRMHNKMFIADGALAIAGGRNMADEYFFSSKGGNFVDFDLLVAGDAVPRMAAIFDTYWNSPRVYPLHAVEPARAAPEALRTAFEQRSADASEAYPSPGPRPDLLGYQPLSIDIAQPALKLLPAQIEVFADNPEKVSGRAETGNDASTVTSRVGRAMSAANSEVVVGSPYFIPGQLGMDGVRVARAHGVRIDVITNSLASNDEPLASAAYSRYRIPMLQLGVNLYETDTRQLRNDTVIGPALRDTIGRSHSKLIIIDRHLTFVGSMNMDFRSSRLNTELGLLVDSPALAAQVLALAERVRSVGSYRLQLDPSGKHIQWVGNKNGVETVVDDEPEADFATRLQLWLLFPFVSESLL